MSFSLWTIALRWRPCVFVFILLVDVCVVGSNCLMIARLGTNGPMAERLRLQCVEIRSRNGAAALYPIMQKLQKGQPMTLTISAALIRRVCMMCAGHAHFSGSHAHFFGPVSSVTSGTERLNRYKHEMRIDFQSEGWGPCLNLQRPCLLRA